MKSKILGLPAVGLLLCAALLGQPSSAAAATLVGTTTSCVWTGDLYERSGSGYGCFRLYNNDITAPDFYLSVVRDPGAEWRFGGTSTDPNFVVDVGPDFVRVTYNNERFPLDGWYMGSAGFLGFWIRGLPGVTGASLSSLSTTTNFNSSRFTFYPNGTSEGQTAPTLFMDLRMEMWTSGKFAQVNFTFDTGAGGNGGGSGTTVPEPGTLALLGLGLAGLGLSRRRKAN